jgi:hypothetical protein
MSCDVGPRCHASVAFTEAKSKLGPFTGEMVKIKEQDTKSHFDVI